jgi:predicted CXXCH cytochrome family protein
MFRKFVGLLTVAVSGLFLSSTAFAAIDGSAHDFAGVFSGSGATDQICVVCHAPHNNENSEGDLLWNRATQTSATYTPYSSPTLDGASGRPGPTSVLCLGCHDGGIAVDSYGGGVSGTQKISSTNALFDNLAAFDTDLSNDHPIGITYDTTATTGDAELHPVGNSMGSNTIGFYLQSGAVECATCHDVHNTDSASNSTLLIVGNTNSALCTTCHDK